MLFKRLQLVHKYAVVLVGLIVILSAVRMLYPILLTYRYGDELQQAVLEYHAVVDSRQAWNEQQLSGVATDRYIRRWLDQAIEHGFVVFEHKPHTFKVLTYSSDRAVVQATTYRKWYTYRHDLQRIENEERCGSRTAQYTLLRDDGTWKVDREEVLLGDGSYSVKLLVFCDQ